MGWYFGFKLHLVCNDKGKIFGDKGCIGKDLFERLFVDGIYLIIKVRKNMKKKAMDYMDKVILRKRAIIETVNDVLKNTCQIEHSRHRSFYNL